MVAVVLEPVPVVDKLVDVKDPVERLTEVKVDPLKVIVEPGPFGVDSVHVLRVPVLKLVLKLVDIPLESLAEVKVDPLKVLMVKDVEVTLIVELGPLGADSVDVLHVPVLRLVDVPVERLTDTVGVKVDPLKVLIVKDIEVTLIVVELGPLGVDSVDVLHVPVLKLVGVPVERLTDIVDVKVDPLKVLVVIGPLGVEPVRVLCVPVLKVVGVTDVEVPLEIDELLRVVVPDEEIVLSVLMDPLELWLVV